MDITGTTLTKELPRLLGLDSPCSFPTCCGDKAARKYAKCLHDGRQAKPNADHFITHKKHKVDCRKCSFWGFELEPAGVSFIKATDDCVAGELIGTSPETIASEQQSVACCSGALPIKDTHSDDDSGAGAACSVANEPPELSPPRCAYDAL
eukprot:scaffold4868_cov416-Prasinococcus_capsulatus_cf.AAC.23